MPLLLACYHKLLQQGTLDRGISMFSSSFAKWLTRILGNYDFKLQLAWGAGKMKEETIRQLGIITKFIEASSCWFIEFTGFWISAVWLFGKTDGSGQHWNVKGKTEGTMGDPLFYLIQCEAGNMHNWDWKEIPLSRELCWTPKTH